MIIIISKKDNTAHNHIKCKNEPCAKSNKKINEISHLCTFTENESMGQNKYLIRNNSTDEE